MIDYFFQDVVQPTLTFNAVRNDIDKIKPEIRVVVQELVYLANLK